jgi:hypothetical protein
MAPGRRPAPPSRGLLPVGLLVLLLTGPGCSFIRDFDAFEAAGDAGPDDPEDAGPVDAGPPPITPEEYAADLAAILCRRSTFCEPKAGLPDLLLQFVCASSVVIDPALRDSPLVRGLLFSTRLFADEAMAELDPELAERCLEALDTNDCTLLSKPFPTVCLAAWRGRVESGGACAFDTDCRTGRCAFDDEDSLVCGGVCVPFTGDGEPCEEDVECIPGRVCRPAPEMGPDGPSPGEPTCLPPASAGEPCAQNFDCGQELWCPVDDPFCAPQPTAGEACERRLFGEDPCAALLVCADDDDGGGVCRAGREDGDDCSFDEPCAPGLRCGEDTDRCFFVAEPGGACASTANCPLLLECVNRAGAFRCVPRPALGEDCSPLLPCAVGVCGDEGTCILLDDGEPCVGDSGDAIRECIGFCDPGPGACAPPRGEGQACPTASACGDGTFCDPDTDQCAVCPEPPLG